MEKIAVIGCGTMGHSIALSAALAGFDIAMHGLNDPSLARGQEEIDAKLEVLSKYDMVSSNELKKIKRRIKTTTFIEQATKDASFIIEAVQENINVKIELFKTLDSLCDLNVILASNTSGLSPTDIASEMLNPERAIVIHFWNPAHLIPLVEIVPGIKTSEKTINRSMQLMTEMKKKPIKVNKDVPGFVGNRLQYALFREAQYLLEEGVASKEDIDAAVTNGFGRRLPVTGPLMTADMGGLDVFSTISNYLFKDLSKAESSLPNLVHLVENGKLGNKTDEGFYQWDTISSKKMNQDREKELIHFFKQDLEFENIERSRS